MSNYFYDSHSLGRPKRQQTFSVYQDDNLQLRKPFRPISNVFDYNLEPSNINSTQFVDGPSPLSGPHYNNRKLTRHHSISHNPPSSVRYHHHYPTYKPDPPVINPAFLDGGVLRPKLFVDEHGFVIELDNDSNDELTRSLPIPITQSVTQFRQPPSMTSNPTRHQYPQYEYSSLNPTTTKPNFHLTKNVQSQLARLSAPVIANSHPYEQQFDNDPSLQFRTTPRSIINPENHRHSNSSADSSSTLVFSSPGSSIHYSSGSDMSSAPNVASLSSSLYYVDCGRVEGGVGGGGGAGTHHSYPGSTADSNRSSICSNSTLTQSSIESHQHEEGADPEPLPPPPPDLVNAHELVDSLPLPPPPLQSEYNRPLSPAPPPPVSIVSLTTTTQPNRVAPYLDQTLLPPAPTLNHEVVTTLRRKHFTTDDSQHYHYPMSTFTNTGTLTHRRPAPPPPPSRAPHHVGSVSSNMSSSSPSPSTSSSSGISDSSSRSSGNSSHCSPSSMSTSFTSSTTSSNCAYDQPKVNMTSPSKLSIPSPDYISPMLNVDPHGNPEAEVTFNKRKSNSPTYGWVYQEPQSPSSIAATNSEENLTSSTNSTHVHLDTFSMSDPGSRFTTMDRNNNSKNQQNPTTYVYNNSAFVHENRIQKDDEDNRIKAKLNNPSYTLFLDDPSVVSRELSELNGGGGSSALNDQLLSPNGTKQSKLPASFECCVRVTRCFTILVCVLLLFFMLGVIGFTLYGRYNGGDTDGLSFWRRFFPLPISDNSTTIFTLSTTIASNLTSTTMFSTISTTLAPTLMITTTTIPTVVLISTTTNSSIPINTPINSNQSELSTLAPIQTTTTLFNQSESTSKFINQSESTNNFANQSESITLSTNQSNVTLTTLSPIQSEHATNISTSQPETLVNQSDFTTPSSSSSLSTINSTVQPTNLTNFDFLNIPNDTIPVNEPVILNVTLLPFTTNTTSPTNQTIVPSPSDALPIIVQSTKPELNNDSLVTTTEQSRNHHPTMTTSSPLDTDITINLPNSTVNPSSNVNSSTTNYPNSQFANDANVTSSTTTTTTGATKIFDDFIIDDLQGGSVGTTSTISTLTTTFTSDDVIKTNELDRNSTTNDERDSRSMEIDDKNSNNRSSVNSVPKDDSSDLINVDALDSFINDIFADHNQTTVEKSTSEVVNSTDESIPNFPNLTTSTQAPNANSTPFEINSVDIQPNITENVSSLPETTTTIITTFMKESFVPEITTTSIPANFSASLPTISTTSTEYSISPTNVSDATSSSTTETKSSAKPTESSIQESTTLSFSVSNSTASSENSDNIHENLEKLFDEFFTNKEETF